MPRTFEDIINHGARLTDTNGLTERDALVRAYNTIEDDHMHNQPDRQVVLGLIRAMLLNSATQD